MKFNDKNCRFLLNHLFCHSECIVYLICDDELGSSINDVILQGGGGGDPVCITSNDEGCLKRYDKREGCRKS